MVLKNNIIDVLNKRIIAKGAIAKCPFYLLSNKTMLKYSTGLLDLKVYILNLKRQVSLTDWLIP